MPTAPLAVEVPHGSASQLDRYMMWGTKAVRVLLNIPTYSLVLCAELTTGTTRNIPRTDLRPIREPVPRYSFRV